MIKKIYHFSLFLIKWLMSRINITSLVMFILLILILLCPYQFSNIFKTSSASSSTTMLSTMAQVLAAILGILLAILLVVYELMGEKYSSYAFKELLNLKEVRLLIPLFIITILFCILSIAMIESTFSIKGYNFLYFSSLLFLACMASLYPCIKKILAHPLSNKQIKELANRIDYYSVNELNVFHGSPSTYIKAIENNPIFILKEVALRAIRDNDPLVPRRAIIESSERLKNIILEHELYSNCRTVIGGFLVIFNDIAYQAITQRQTGVLRTVLDVLKQMHIFAAEKRIAYDQLIELDQTLEEILLKIVSANFVELSHYGFSILQDIMASHLHMNIPSASDLQLLDENSDHVWTSADCHKILQWRQVASGYRRIMFRMIQKAVSTKNTQIISYLLYCYARIPSELNRLRLAQLQRGEIIKTWSREMENLILKCANNEIFNKSEVIFPFCYLEIFDILKEKADYSQEPLRHFCETIIQLFQKNMLSTSILNDLGTIGRRAVDLIDDNYFAAAVIYICRIFDSIRKCIESRKQPEDKHYYLDAHRQIMSLQNFMRSKGKTHPLVEKEISAILNNFTELERFRKSRDKSAIDEIEWPDLGV